MKLLFTDGSEVEITLADNPVSKLIHGMYRNLQYLPLPFKEWDNPYYNRSSEYNNIVNKLAEFGKAIGVDVDPNSCLDCNQSYFNDLHKIYEKNYNGNPLWLDFHETIHLCENFGKEKNRHFAFIDYREKSGPLEKPFNLDWLNYTTTNINEGDVFVRWAELGKTPYSYWEDQEPNDIARMCELSKPWLKLRAKLNISIANVDTLQRFQVNKFNSWWKDYEEKWCQHWGLPHWGIHDIASVSVIGRVKDLDLFKLNLQKSITPNKVKL